MGSPGPRSEGEGEREVTLYLWPRKFIHTLTDGLQQHHVGVNTINKMDKVLWEKRADQQKEL